MFHILLMVLLLAGLISVAYLVQQKTSLFSKAAGNSFYVSKLGSNSDGTSWASAWNELSNINWAVVQPGDTIYLDGGSSSMVYNSTLTVGRSGTFIAPITIKLSSEPERNGKAIIDGGLTSWEECQPGAVGNPESSPGGLGVRTVGIKFNSAQHVVVDGTKWNGIVVRNHNNTGISISGSNNTIRYIESYANDAPDGGNQDGWGVTGNGSNLVLSHLNLHHNGQDAIQFNGAVNGLKLEYSYLHDHYCRHPDGVQVWGGAVSTNWEISHNVIANGFMQGIFLGENAVGYNAYVDGANIHDNLIYDLLYGIKSKHTLSKNWDIHHNTMVNTSAFGVEWCCGGATAPMTIRDNIFYNVASFYFPTAGGNTTFTNNCAYNAGNVGGNVTVTGKLTSDPQFSNASAKDFSLKSDSPCTGKGSSITSLTQLLSMSEPLPTTNPGSSPTPRPTIEPFGGLSFEAESGVISSPFMVSNGLVYQTTATDTDPLTGGRAEFSFNVAVTGEYVVKVMVDAASAAANSLYVNIDDEPTTPTMVWDISVTTGIQERTVSWRGTGTVDANQYTPKVFNLTSGTHTLIIRGREANTRLDKIAIELLQAATTPTLTTTPTRTPTLRPTSTPLPTQIPSPTLTAGCDVSSGNWVNRAFTPQTGMFTVTFDATPRSGLIDGVVGLSSGAASAYTNTAATIRFNPNGNIDAFSGSGYQSSTIPYYANQTYHFRLVVNLSNHTYTAYVTAPGDSERLIGSNYVFRQAQASVTSLSNLASYTISPNSTVVCNLVVSASAPTGITLEAENMSIPKSKGSVYSDSNASGGKGLLLSSATKATGTVAGSFSNLALRAKGDQCGGAPHMMVKVDGVVVMNTNVSNTSYNDFYALAKAGSGTHNIEVIYDNDRVFLCDRNLRLDYLRLTP